MIHFPSLARLRYQCAAAAALTIAAIPAVAQQSGGLPADPCAVLTRDEVAKVLGRNDLGRARPEARPAGEAACRYPGRVGAGVTIAFTIESRDEFDKNMKGLVEAGAELKPLPDLGEVAFVWEPDRLYALHRGTSIGVSLSSVPAGGAAKAEANLIALARAVIAKL